MPYDKLGDEYLLLKELGEGGYATVYKAKSLKYGYIRAIRVLNAHVEKESDKIYQNFLHECRVLLRLGNGCHPNIVHVYQPRHVAGRAFVEMDWVDGVDLRKLIEQNKGKVPIDETLRMVQEMASALAYCHRDIYKVCYDRESDSLEDADDGSALITPEVEQRLIEKYRVVHNDIHTGNIMRRSDGAYILLDFGLAVDGKSDVVGSSRKKQGAIEFKSPDRSNGLDPTPQDDIYSFGCVLYAMLTGRPPFPVEDNAKILTEAEICRIFIAHRDEQPQAIRRDDAPKWLVDMTMRCLAKKPADRYADGYELYQDVLRNMESQKKSDSAALAVENKAMTQKIDSLENEKKALAKNLDDMHAQYDKTKETGVYLLQMLDERTNQNKTLTDNVDKLQTENDILKKRINKSKNHRPSWLLLVLFVALAAVLTYMLMPKQEKAEANVAATDNDSIGLLTAENEGLRSRIDSLENMLDLMKASNKDNAVLMDEIASLNAKNAALERENKKLASDNGNLQTQNTKLSTRNRTLAKDSANLSSENKRLNNENARLRNNDQSKTIDDLKKRNKEQEKQIKVLRTENEEQKKEIEFKEQMVNSLKKNVSKLGKDLEECEKRK